MLDRRRFLALVGSSAVVACDGPGPEVEPSPEDQPRTAAPGEPWAGVAAPAGVDFPMGVQAGDPTPDGARLWTRYTGAGSLSLVVAVWDGEAWQAVEERPVTPAEGGYVHADVEGLGPDTHVAFQLRDDLGGASPTGRFTTAPAGDRATVVRIGCGSCFDQDHEAFPSLAEVAALGLDAFVFLGDTAYFDGRSTVEGFRSLWQQNLSAPGFRELLSSTAVVYTWDDHEVDNNFDAERIDPVRLEIARAAMLEATPMRLVPPERLWRRLVFGATVELFVLDCRGERRPSIDEYLSPEQLQWLIDGVRASTARWKLVANSVPIMAFEPDLWKVNLNDRWEGYPAQRAALLAAIADVPGVVFLSGDVHCPILARVAASGDGAAAWDVVAGPGGSFLNPLGSLLPGTPNVLWADVEWNAVHLELSSTGTMRVRFVGEDGAALCDAVLDDRGEVVSLTAAPPAGS
jgi:alkaline phosphatase D